MTSRQPGATPQDWLLRLLPLAMLIVLGLAGLRGAVATPRWDGPLHRDGLAVGSALEVVLLILFVVTLDLALRGAAAAARAYTDARDRVGVITYQWGGASWLVPGLGRRQVYRIIDSMLASDAGWARGASFRRLPRAALPPGALVVVFSPLLDQRFVETLRDMRERGFTMLVVDVLNAEPPARPRMPSRGGLGGSFSRASTDRMARRIWRMEQEAIRFSLRELGVPVVHWDGVKSLDLPLAAHSRRPMAARR